MIKTNVLFSILLIFRYVNALLTAMTATVSNCAQASCATDQLHYYINYDKAYPSHNYQLTDTCIHCLSMLETSSFTLPQPQPQPPQIGYSYETVWETHKSEFFVEIG